MLRTCEQRKTKQLDNLCSYRLETLLFNDLRDGNNTLIMRTRLLTNVDAMSRGGIVNECPYRFAYIRDFQQMLLLFIPHPLSSLEFNTYGK